MAPPDVWVLDDPDGVASVATDVVARLLVTKPNAVLALPTGRTPIDLYRELARRTKAGAIDWSQARAFNLDEWVGVSPESPGSFARFMDEHLFADVNLPAANRFIPSGMASDPDRECRAYEAAIVAAGGIDLAILGLGTNGHIGFNEPGTLFETVTHVAVVTEQTRAANAYTFPDGRVPERAITVGIATILQARRILLLVTGTEKSEILRTALIGPVDVAVPASALQRHDSVTVVADRAAMSCLPERLREGQPSGCA